MAIKHPKLGLKKTIPLRRGLRKNLTVAERILWNKLRAHQFSGINFRRQHGMGPYIVDFCSRTLSVIIEIDGDIHAITKQADKDKARQHYLESLGFKVIRYANDDVINNLEGVLIDMFHQIERLRPPPNPYLSKEGRSKENQCF